MEKSEYWCILIILLLSLIGQMCIVKLICMGFRYVTDMIMTQDSVSVQYWTTGKSHFFFTRPFCPSSYYHDFILILKAQLCFQPKVQPKHKSISGVILVLTGVENKLLEAWLETQREGEGDPLSSYSQIGSWWLLDFFPLRNCVLLWFVHSTGMSMS